MAGQPFLPLGNESAAVIPSPKVTGPGVSPIDTWYKYYAGFSSDFVEGMLRVIADGPVSVLDPWNGTGTTTVIAAKKGGTAFGFDVNPALVIIAKARHLSRSVSDSLKPLMTDIVLHSEKPLIPQDPLQFWFDEPSAATIRGIQMSIDRLLVDGSGSVAGDKRADKMSTLAAFFYAALFRSVRVLASPSAGSNPTWWKKPSVALELDQDAVVQTFKAAVAALAGGLHGNSEDHLVNTMLATSDSKGIPLSGESIDAIVTSPPYCTRIDYGIATRPELAVLGFQEAEIRLLRDSMIGTPTMVGAAVRPADWSPLVDDFLSAISAHESRASSGYYLRYYEQYYTSMWRSLQEIHRVCKPGGSLVLVVQDNHYKEIHNDTPGLLADMAERLGFVRKMRRDFGIPRTKAAINPRSRVYRKKATAIESVLVFEKH